jgi:signal transduction histidine kinase
MRPRILQILLGAWVLAQGLVAQGPGRMPVQSFGRAQGLPEVRINAMIQDRVGRYWVAGELGLYVGDGHTFLRTLGATTSDRPLFRALLEDDQGRILVAGQTGLWRLEADRWRHLELRLPRRGEGEPLALVRDGAGGQWLLWGSHLYRMGEGNHLTPVPLPGPGLPYLTGRLGTAGLHLRIEERTWTWSEGRWTPLPDLPLRRGEQCRAPIQEDRRGHLWTGSYLRVFHLEPGATAWREHNDPYGNKGFAGGTAAPGGVSSPGEGEVWAMGDQVAYRLDAEAGTLATTPAFSIYSMTLLLRDREGHLWADRDGLHRLGGPWRQFGGLDGLPASGFWQVVRDARGTLWASSTTGLYRAGEGRWDRIWGSGLHAQLGLGADQCLWAVERLSGRLLRFDTRTGKPVPLPGPVTGLEGIRGVSAVGDTLAFPTRDHRIVLGTWGGAAWGWRFLRPPVTSGSIRTFADPRGLIQMVGFDEDRQIYHSQQGGPWRPLPLEVGRDVTDAATTANGDLQVVQFMPPAVLTLRLKEDRWSLVQALDLDRVSPARTAYTLGTLPDGRTWLLTDHGVLELDPRHPDRARHFTAADGLPLDDCNQFGLFIEAERIWVSTGTGLGAYDLRLEAPLPELPRPFLLGARVDDGDWSLALPSELPHGTRAFTLQVGLPSPARRAHLRFQWQDLERGGEWQEFEGPTLSFLDPGAGAHHIRVRALEPGDHPSPAWECIFHVLRPWWQRPWALGLWALLALGGVMAFNRFRFHRIQQRNRELAALVAQRTEALAASEARERAASRAKSSFLADMSHELRTPLNAILLYSELIHQDAEEAGQTDLARDSGRVLSSGRHLLSLINGILDLSKVEAGKMTVALEEVPLLPLFEEVVLTLEPLAREREDALELDLPDREVTWCTDPLKLRQVLINLAGNAIKFTAAGHVVLAARKEGAGLVIEVRDSGVGMSPEQTERLFRPYEQPTQERGYKAEGTGLGLTICRRFVELLQGTITVDSRPGVGTTFRIQLPIPDPPTVHP